jgi:hypothetical protein
LLAAGPAEVIIKQYTGNRDMERNRVFIFQTTIFLFFLAAVPNVFAVSAKVLPAKISPGDAFVIRVEGATTSVPEAELGGNSLDFTSCGKGCFETIDALGLDAHPGSHKIMVKAGQTDLKVNVTVKRTVFPTITLTLPEREVILGPKDLKRAKREERLMESIWQKETPRLWEGRFILPLPTEVSSPFGLRRVMNGERVSIHKGIDMKGREGQAIRACNNGRVVLARNLFFGGNTVVIDHGTGIYSIYMHLSKFDVRPGEMVSKGQTLGLVGSTGRATGPHLHFSMRVSGISANPVSFTRLPL